MQIRRIRESLSIFGSNIPQQIFKNELEAMFWRQGRIIDEFIPVDIRSNSNRGFTFIKFVNLREAVKAVEIAEGRSCGGRKVKANIAQFSSNRRGKKDQERSKERWEATSRPFYPAEEFPPIGFSEKVLARAVEGNCERLNSKVVGWIAKEGTRKGVRVAPWVIKEQETSLYHSLVGFLKSKSGDIKQTDQWLDSCAGIRPCNTQTLDDQVIWMQFSSQKEVEEVLLVAASPGGRMSLSLFSAGEMNEGIGFPTKIFLDYS